VKLASFLVNGRLGFGAVTDGGIVELSKRSRFIRLLDVLHAGALKELQSEAAGKTDYALADVTLLPPVPAPEKIICVGVNYANRNEEYKDGSEPPQYPSLFLRFPGSFVGHDQPLVRPKISEQLDYEGEIVLIIGREGRHVPRERALEHIAGVTLGNEGTVRDWLRHGKFNVTQGKNFDRTGSVGPWMVTADAIDWGKPMHLTTRVNGETRQDDTTENFIFDFPFLISYITSFATLKPGDVILTGTPTGAGARFDPPRWLKPGDVVEVAVPQIGTLRNRVIDE
jgi:2-keto-4-pentenoate hydratase/2-oxohepta-3-ene-1,7-dioic acid hydratase in catechol pathway